MLSLTIYYMSTDSYRQHKRKAVSVDNGWVSWRVRYPNVKGRIDGENQSGLPRIICDPKQGCGSSVDRQKPGANHEIGLGLCLIEIAPWECQCSAKGGDPFSRFWRERSGIEVVPFKGHR
jgi:hypothetical protein